MAHVLGQMKPIRSFIRRERRLSQYSNFEKLWALYGVQHENNVLDLDKHFVQKGPITLEIGFGSGEQLITKAHQNLDHRFIGIEVYRKGIDALLSEIEKYNLSNIRILEGDAVEILKNCIPDNSIDCIDILFPDPWPKRRHHKRRLLQNSFTPFLIQKFKPGGQLYVATDWTHYANHILRVLENTTGLVNQNGTNQFSSQRKGLALTKFKKRGLELGHSIYYLSFRKCL